jgi:hypothetical protein
MAQLNQTVRSARPVVGSGLTEVLHLRALALPLALALLAILAVFLGYQRPRVVTLPADDYHTKLLTGFNKLESNELRVFRWTNGDARVCVPRTGYASTAFLDVQLLGSAPLRQGIDRVTLRIGEGTPVVVPLRDGEHWYSLVLPPGNSENGDSCVRLQSDTFLEGSNPRRLGVPFGSMRLELWTPGGLVWPPLDLLLMVGLLTVCSYTVIRRLSGSALAGALPILIGMAVLLCGVYLQLITITFDTARMLIIPLTASAYAVLTMGVWAGFRRWALERYPVAARPLALELLAVALSAIALYGGRELAQLVTGHHSFYPLKAGVWPNPNWLLVWPALLYAAFLAFVLQALRERGPLPLRWLLPLLVLFAAVMPVALRVSVRGWDSLLYTYRDNPSDYIHDVWRIGNDVRGFLGQYVELSPSLRLHNRNHPPGSVLMLWGVERLFGPGPAPATVVTVLLAATAVLPVFWLGRSIGGERLGLLAAALYAVMPGHLIYTTTSMDAIHNTMIIWATWAFWMALRPDGRPAMALLCGLLLALALFLNFSTLTLGIFGIAVLGYLLTVGYRYWVDPVADKLTREPGSQQINSLVPARPLVSRPGLFVLRQAALIALALLAFYALLYAWSGFNIVQSILAGTRNNFDEVQQDLPPTGLATYMFYILVNLVPYMWYLTFWGLPIMLRQGLRGVQRWGQATPFELLAGGWLILVMGLAFYGIVAVVVAGFLLTNRSSLWWAGLGLTQFFLVSMFFRTWLNTYW